MMSRDIVESYRKLRKQASALGASPGFVGRSEDYAAGIWKYDDDLLSLIPGGVAGKVVLDFGAKYGHIIPLLFARGATRGIDVEDEYLAEGRRIFSNLYSNAQFIKSQRGFERPYRYGTCPTNPSPGGVVMERPFHPEDVIRSLGAHRVGARQVFHPQYAEELKKLAHWSRFFRRLRRLDLVGAFTMFQILGQNAGSSCDAG